LFGEFVYHNK